MPDQQATPGALWLALALVTVVCWGLYGFFLHTGQLGMADPVGGRYKAFLCVGIAYVLIAVLAPLALLVASGSSWTMPAKGLTYSLIAGIVGAVGALCVLLAFGARGQPAVVMSIIFAGAPIVNAIVVMAVHPPAGGLAAIKWPFLLGIVLAAAGGTLVTLYRPIPVAPTAKPPAADAAPVSGAER